VGTTIQLDKKVRDKLRELKIHPRESYNKVVERLLAMRTDEGELSEETIRDIEQSLEDVKAGRTMSMKEVKQRLKKE
jgi:predicted transcriptional regulator